MLPKHQERLVAVRLRKLGKSYSEILSQVEVSQSTLSLWFRNTRLTEKQIDHLLLRKKWGQTKGGIARKSFREKQQKTIITEAKKQIDNLSDRELWLLGTIAYWCEGAKQKEYNVSQGVVFANSDPFLLKLFLKWLKNICEIEENRIVYSLYIHENADFKKAITYWSNVLKISQIRLGKPVLKKHIILTNRKNQGDSYQGLIRIVVKKSTNLNRKIIGWIRGVENFLD